MINQKTLNDISIEELKETKVVPLESGKILKVYVDFYDVNCEVNLEILTFEGEQVIYASNNDDVKTFYPRANITEGIYTESNLSVETRNLDYYYFTKGLILNIDKNNANQTGSIIKEVRIFYEVPDRSEQPNNPL